MYEKTMLNNIDPNIYMHYIHLFLEECLHCVLTIIIVLASTLSGIPPENLTMRTFIQGIFINAGVILLAAWYADEHDFSRLGGYALMFVAGTYAWFINGAVISMATKIANSLAERIISKWIKD